MNYRRIICCTLCLAVLGCGKNSSDNQPTKTEIITKASWKYDNAGIDVGRDGTVDSPLPAGTLPVCTTDNILMLNANGTGTVDEGATKCDAAAPQNAAITWSFTNNENTLNLGGNGISGISGQVKILELSDTRLSLSKDTTVPFLGAAALVVVLKH